jgi:UDP-4-amino-4-deoxy-L-arabinose formyltransferase/UDP-glucuronic acid dehydrogenase (UDP-4-keto-hexauronic acid decarboxylating)
MERKFKIAIIGRTEILYETTLLLHAAGHKITCIITAKEAPEYIKTSEDFEN